MIKKDQQRSAFATGARWLRRGTIALALLAAPVAHAAVDDADPSASVAPVLSSGDPIALAELLQTLSARGETAVKKGDHATAARYWRAATLALPERAAGFSRLCDALDAGGKAEEALVACRTALTREGTTAGDYTHFVRLLLAQGGPLTAADRRQIDLAITQLAKEPAAALITDRVRCNVAAREHDVAALEACTARLAAAAPAEASTIAFQWTLALEKGDVAGAKQQMARASAAGLAPASFRPLALRTQGPGSTRAQQFVRWALLGLGVTLGLFVSYALAVRHAASRRRRVAVRA